MKRKLIIFALLLIMILPLRIQAADKYDGVLCKYKAKCQNSEGQEFDVGRYTFIYISHDNNEAYHLIYADNTKEKTLSNSLIGNPMLNLSYKDYLNHSKFGNIGLQITNTDGTESNSFEKIVNTTGDCPQLHCAFSNKTMYLSPVNVFSSIKNSGKEYKDVVSDAIEISVCKNGDQKCSVSNGTLAGNWSSTSKSNSDIQDCSYSLNPENENGDKYMKKSDSVDVSFQTIYESGDSSNGYIIKIDGKEEAITDINSDFNTNFYENGKEYPLMITADNLKSLFGSTCLDKDKVYLYVGKLSDGMKIPVYKITTNRDDILDDKVGVSDPGTYDPKVVPISDKPMSCQDLLKEPLLSIIKGSLTIIQIVAAIITIVRGMMLFIPAVIAKDADALKKASKQLAVLGVLLALVIIFRPLVIMIGKLLEYDISCIV